MKRFAFFATLLLVFATGFSSMHKYYVSTTNVEYSEKDQTLQVITRIFVDDLELLLKERYGLDAKLGTLDEAKSTDQFLQKYFSQKMTFKVNGAAKNLQFLGKVYETDMVKCYIEIKDIGEMESILVQNQILFDLYEDQQNIVHLKLKGKRKSFLLIRGNDKGLLKF